MKTLHLTLKKKWFDMIRDGEKSEEYREIKPYWKSRLATAYPNAIGGDFMDEHVCIAYRFKTFEWIQFRNGYSKDAPNMLRHCAGIEIREGKPEWGAEPGKKYFVIKLGERIV